MSEIFIECSLLPNITSRSEDAKELLTNPRHSFEIREPPIHRQVSHPQTRGKRVINWTIVNYLFK